tara:strand:- start:1326 stop:2252 length:927 start_codon:yes stop_codon:yes gene_type:complete
MAHQEGHEEDNQQNSGGGFSFGNMSASQAELLGTSLTSAVGGIGSLAGGIAGMVGQQDRKDAAEKEMQTALADLQKVKDTQPSLSTPSEYYKMVSQAYDQRLMQQRLEDINRSLATTTQAASQFGARGLGAVMQASQQAQQAQRQETLTQQRLQTEALGQLAGARERETRLKEARSTRDFDYAYDAKALAEARQAQVEQQRIQNISNVVGGVAGIAGGAIGMGAAAAGLENGGKIAKRGVKVTKTPGEFSHKRNPLHVVDNGGEKVAELTGGEYVFNPEQSKKLMQLAKDGDSQLHKYLFNLLKKFEK